MKSKLNHKPNHTPGPRLKNNPDAAALEPCSATEHPAATEPLSATEAHAATEPVPGPDYRMPPRRWFLTFMCMNIPIVGWIYLLRLAFSRKENQLRDFAKAYLLYKLVFLSLALVLLGILVYIGLDLADKILAYMEML